MNISGFIVGLIFGLFSIVLFATKFPPDSKMVGSIALLAVGYAGYRLGKRLTR